MSNINTESLDDLYPVAGANNDSQGFRDNFNNIKHNLNVAKSEIEVLETHALRSDQDNDFNAHTISNINIDNNTVTSINQLALYQDSVVKYPQGGYHQLVIGNNLKLSLDDWPSNNYAKLIIEIVGSSSESYTVEFTGSRYSNRVKYQAGWPSSEINHRLIVTETYSHVVEFWTINGGTDVYASYIGRF